MTETINLSYFGPQKLESYLISQVKGAVAEPDSFQMGTAKSKSASPFAGLMATAS